MAKSNSELVAKITNYFLEPEYIDKMKDGARKRSLYYKKEQIMEKLLFDIELGHDDYSHVKQKEVEA